MNLRVGTLASSEMLSGPHAGRRRLYERAAAAGIDHVFVADHVSFHTGLGMDGLLQAATAAAHSETLGVYVGVYLLALRHPTPVARQIASFAESVDEIASLASAQGPGLKPKRIGSITPNRSL